MDAFVRPLMIALSHIKTKIKYTIITKLLLKCQIFF